MDTEFFDPFDDDDLDTSEEIIEEVPQVLINWDYPNLIPKVTGDPSTYPYPEILPHPSTWPKVYRRSMDSIQRVIDLKAEKEYLTSISFQLDLFDTSSDPKNKLYECQLGQFYIHDSMDTFLPVVERYIREGKPVAADIETTGLNAYNNYIRTFQMSNDGKEAHILLVENVGDEFIPAIKDLFENVPFIFQNGLFDLHFLLVFTGCFPKKLCFDTLLAAQVADAGLYEGRDKAFGLGGLAKRYLGIHLDKTQQKSFHKTVNEPMSFEAMKYAANDALATWRIAMVLSQVLEEKNLVRVFREIDLPCIAPAVDIKVRGVPVDKSYLSILKEKYDPQIQDKIQEIELSGIPREVINSPSKLLVKLKELGFTDLTSTGEGALGTYFLGKNVRQVKPKERDKIREKSPAVASLLEYREMHKAISYIADSFLGKFYNPLTKCVHPNLNVCGSLSESGNEGGRDIATGRFSATDPNFMNIKSGQEWRDIFKAPEGYVYLKVDASQQEVRVMAEIAEELNLQRIYLEDKEDVYKETAALVLRKPVDNVTTDERKCYKTVVLGVGYGSSAFTVSTVADIPFDKAEKAVKGFHKTFPAINKALDKYEAVAKGQGFIANTFSGRKRHWNHKRMIGKEYKYRTQGLNFLIQGGSADCTKKAFIMAYKMLTPLGCRPMPPVHDEVIFLCPIENANEAMKILCNCMIKGSEYFLKIVPMKAEGAFGYTWRKEASICEFCQIEEKGGVKIRAVKLKDRWAISCKECYLAKK
jgi:DNA polymerase I